MKTRYQLSKLTFCLATFFMHSTVSFDPPSPDDSSACVLNFTSYPYQPTGECVGSQEKIKVWGSLPTTLCCRNALTVLSRALALRAKLTGGNIFIEENLWKNCNNSFPRQQSVSVDSCGFDDLFYRSSACSALSLQHLKNHDKYQYALHMCSQFDSSFDEACKNCIGAILGLRDHLLSRNEGNGTERAICGVAIVISIAAGTLDDPSLNIDDFYGCLPALDVLEPGYIKIKYSVVKSLFVILIASPGLMLVIMVIKYVNKHKPAKPVQLKEISTCSGLYRFTKAEIENAINIGTEKMTLGRGSAGHVYKGILPSGQQVAIKHIFNSRCRNTSDSFKREVEGLSRVRHPNLVCLFGCCVEDGEQYLVYEYCSSGNLAQHLLKNDTVLTWERRVKILRDCALALRYLHHYIDGCIVHRDIKLTNILLTENLDPKLSDFGLAKMLGMEEGKVFMDDRGTNGYMDPEYMSYGKLTCASDIYSFGIVALQLLSGKAVIELDLGARNQLTRKAKDVIMGKRPPTDFEDPRLNGNAKSVDFESILKVAVLCVAKSSKGRPTIDVVYDEMDKAWKNTLADLRAKREMSTSATPQSRSLEAIPV